MLTPFKFALLAPVIACCVSGCCSTSDIIDDKAPAPAADAILIDVREVDEYRTDSIATAVNVPMSNFANTIMETVPNKGTTIYLHCRSGGRAGRAQALLTAKGYKNVTNLGGIDDARTYIKTHKIN